MTKQQKILLSLVAIVAALGAGLYFVNTSSTMNSANTDMTSSSNTNTVTGSASVVSSNGAANGDSGSVTITAVPVSTRSDSATVSFQVPENKTNSFTLRITQDGGVITNVSYSESTKDRESSEYYNSFIKSFKTSDVVGKKIEDVSLSRVGGASLTTKAFMSALATIAAKN